MKGICILIADEFENTKIYEQDKYMFSVNPSVYHAETKERLESFKEALRLEYVPEMPAAVVEDVWGLAWDFSCEFDSRDSYHDVEYFYSRLASVVKTARDYV